jgi:hypothetical protein
MQAVKFLHKLFSDALPNIHLSRLNALFQTIESLLNQGQLTLTSLGRNMIGGSKVKHKIKKVDRILGNQHLFEEQFYIYQNLSKKLFKYLTEAVIIVDWSGCCSQERWILQASLVTSGRSIPIYKEIHKLKKISNPKVEKDFLKKLSKIIPDHIKITVVTDAGFKKPWFKAVRALDWHFVGRIRRPMQLFFEKKWIKVLELGVTVSASPRFLGEAILGKTTADLSAYIYGFRTRLTGRKMKKKKYHSNMYPDKQDIYSRVHKDPWIIATSLGGSIQLARRIINIYKSRMQIEQNFRDDKNQRWGFALRYSRTENIKRLAIMLLIAFIATFMLCMIGIIAEEKKMQFDFQANTIRKTRVLSITMLAKQVLKHSTEKLTLIDYEEALRKIKGYQVLDG